jgi:hypothetical protein
MSYKSIDKYELYSFTTYLYFYGIFYLYIFEQKLLIAILSTILSNILLLYIFQYNFISFLCHKYWKENLNNIAMPQLLTCLSNIIIYNYKLNYILIILINIFLYYIIKNVYKKEVSESINLRFIIIILFVFTKIVFSKFF